MIGPGHILAGQGIAPTPASHVLKGGGMTAAPAGAANVAPVAEFSHAVTNLTVDFTDLSSDADGSIVAWDWDWGDGTAHGTTQHPQHVYTAWNDKTVRLTVTDDKGGTHFVEHVVTPVPVPAAWQATGTPAENAGALTVVPPAHIAGDDLWLIVTTGGTEIPTLSTPAGFTAVADSPQNEPSAIGTGVVLSVFHCRATSGAMASPVVADSGNHQYGVIISTRGGPLADDAIHVTAGDVLSTSSTSVTVPGDTTTIPNCLIMAIAAHTTDAVAATPQFSAWANASLASIDERFDGSTDLGFGSGVGVATGVKVAAGAVSPTTATLANTSRQARIMLALKGRGA